MQPPTKRARLDPAAVAAVAPVCQLFRLPRELLELVAAYFSRYEAVPVLTVNSTFHEIFAERIWRRLDTPLTQDLPIPQASLLRYGHLVRRIRVTELIPRSIDLAAAFPNITHLWIPFSRLVDTVKLSQGKCFERLSWLGTWAVDADYDMPETSDDVDPVLSWIDSRFEADAGMEKVEWNIYNHFDLQLPHNILQWFQRNGQLDRIHFKVANEGLDFGDAELSDAENADFKATIPRCLADWKVEEYDDECAAYLFSNILDSIPSTVRQWFAFPILQRLRIGTCCAIGNEVYSQFNFGRLFPSVRDLTLDIIATYCQGDSEDAFSAVLAHPWPSVRKLNVYSGFTLEQIIPHLAVLSNVEELSMDRDCTAHYIDWKVFNLYDLDRALPKLVRLKLNGTELISAPQEQQQQQQQQQQLFRHLRYLSLEVHTLTPSAISMLIRAPLLTGICLDRVDFTIDDDAAISDEDDDDDEDDDEDDEDEDPRRKKSPINLDFLDGVTNPAVRSVDINFTIYRSPVNYDDVFRAMLKCFVRLGVCTIQSEDKKALPGLQEEFPNVRFKRIE